MEVMKWYYSNSFIAFCFATWFLILPPIAGFMLLKKQREILQQTYEELQEDLQGKTSLINRHIINVDSIVKQESKIKELEDERTNLDKYIRNIKQEKLEAFEQLLLKKEKNALANLEKRLGELKTIREADIEENINLIYRDSLKKLAVTELVTRLKKVSLEKESKKLKREVSRKVHQLRRLRKYMQLVKDDIVDLNEEHLMQTFGFYEPRYDFASSIDYKVQLEKVRNKQKEMVRDGMALNSITSWTLDNSLTKGRAMNRKNEKIVLRSFNNECEVIVDNVKYNNIEASEKKIRKAKEQLDKLNSYNRISIKDAFVDLKIQEMQLAYEFALKKEEEKHELRRQRELLREEQRIQKEIDERLQLLQKEEQHYLNALSIMNKRLEKSNIDGEQENIINQINQIQEQLNTIEEEKQDLDFRVRNNKAGYVYIISNIGAFGEGIYKIGMTRRLDPYERMRELSGASVPFPYDVHALIFSEDAPKLESQLHNQFQDLRVNQVNNRKEFFKVSLKEIEKVVRKNYKKPIELIQLGLAKEYHETLAINKSKENHLTKEFIS